jgi:large subunit ribosomal protein L9
MEIILLEKIENVGTIGDRVKVKSGYARNFLIPKGKATLATPDNIAKFESIRADLEKKAADELADAQARASKLEGKVIRIVAQAGSEGKLFGSVGPIDIAAALEALKLEVERSEIRMADGPLRVLGEHKVELHFHTDVDVELSVIVETGEGDHEILMAKQAAAAAESAAAEAARDAAEAEAAAEAAAAEADEEPDAE